MYPLRVQSHFLLSGLCTGCPVLNSGSSIPRLATPHFQLSLGQPILLLASPLESAQGVMRVAWNFTLHSGFPSPSAPASLRSHSTWSGTRDFITVWPQFPACQMGRTVQLCSLLGHTRQEQTQTRRKLSRKKEDVLLSKGTEY